MASAAVSTAVKAATESLAFPKRSGVFQAVLGALEEIAPVHLAGSWDNVGLLLDTCRTSFPTPFNVFITNDLTEKVVDEAVAKKADLIVSYHPTPFRKFNKVVRENPVGRVVLKAASRGIAIYSPHTALDCAPGGVNDWLVSGLGAGTTVPAQPNLKTDIENAGAGRILTLEEPVTLDVLIARVKKHLKLDHIRVAVSLATLPQDAATPASVTSVATSVAVQKIAACAGSGVSVIGHLGDDVDVLLTGEMSHHEVLAANAEGKHVILTDHSNTERGYLPVLQSKLEDKLADHEVAFTITAVDADPLVVV